MTALATQAQQLRWGKPLTQDAPQPAQETGKPAGVCDRWVQREGFGVSPLTAFDHRLRRRAW